MQSIGYRIRCAREQAGITQEQLGKLCGTTKQTIFKYENGIVTNIPMDRIPIIAKALEVNPCYLMGWSNVVAPEDCEPNLNLSSSEHLLIKKFRALDDRGKSAVLNVLYHEYDSLPGEESYTSTKEA